MVNKAKGRKTMRKMKLQTQLMVYFILCISVVFAIQLFVVDTQVGGLQDRQSESLNTQLIQAKADEIGAWFNQRLCEMRIATRHAGFNTMDLDVILPYLTELNSYVSGTYGDLEQPFVISDTAGTVYLPNGETMDISQREYFQQAFASQKEYTISKPLFSRLAWQRVVIISYAIRNDEGKKIGYVHGSLLLSKIDEILSEISVYDGVVWIMDDEGRVLAEDDNHTHGEGVSRCPKSYNLTPIATELAKAGNGMADMALNTGGEGVLIYAPIPYAKDWKLCVLVSRTVMDAPMRQVSNSILLVYLFLVAAVALLSLVYVRSKVRPLDSLANAMDNVDLDHPSPWHAEGGSREIRRLGNSFNRMTDRIGQLHGRVIEEQELKREAERREMQAQINPHFLYNTLDTISWKALEHNDEEVADIIGALSRFFRLSLNRGEDFVALEHEVEHVYSYLYIQRIRYEDRLDFNVEMEEGLRGCLVPKLLLQPLVENAIYHGIKLKGGSGQIRIRIKPHGKDISIVVADDGAGMTAERLCAVRKALADENHSMGFGLCSMAKRLRLTYGAPYGASVHSIPGKGTAVRLLLPRHTEKR